MEAATSQICILCCNQFSPVNGKISNDPREIQAISKAFILFGIQVQNAQKINRLVCIDCCDTLKDATKWQSVLRFLESRMKTIKNNLNIALRSILHKIQQGDKLSVRVRVWTSEYPEEVLEIRDEVAKFAEEWQRDNRNSCKQPKVMPVKTLKTTENDVILRSTTLLETKPGRTVSLFRNHSSQDAWEGVPKISEKLETKNRKTSKQLSRLAEEIPKPTRIEKNAKPLCLVKDVGKVHPFKNLNSGETRNQAVPMPRKDFPSKTIPPLWKPPTKAVMKDRKLKMRAFVRVKRLTKGMILQEKYKLKKKKKPRVVLISFGSTDESSLHSDQVEEEGSEHYSSAESSVVYVRRKSKLSLWAQKVVAALYGKQKFEQSLKNEEPKWKLKFNRKLNRLTFARVPILLNEESECLKCGKCRGNKVFQIDRRPECYWKQITGHIKSVHLKEQEEKERVCVKVEKDWDQETWDWKPKRKLVPQSPRANRPGDRVNGCVEKATDAKIGKGTLRLRKKKKYEEKV